MDNIELYRIIKTKRTSMTKRLIFAGIAMMMIAISSCDNNTEATGYSLVDGADHFTIATDTFNVATRSILVSADSLITRSDYTYLGRIKDPETGAYITSDYITEFNLLEGEASKLFADKDKIISLEDGEIIADSCVMNIILESYQGDSLTAMKLQLCELDRPIDDDRVFYSSFDPEEKNYLRSDSNAIRQSQVFSISDLTLSDSIRSVNSTNSYYEYVRVPLNRKYIDKQGNPYKNYGTYIMRQYYDHPEFFKNSNSFISNVCPGFYIKCVDGLGVMMEVAYTQLHVYYRYLYNNQEYSGIKTFTATPEVLRASHIVNDYEVLDSLKNEQTCTYLKTPAGLFTEVELPVKEIKMGRALNGEHEQDTITMAKIVFHRLNVQNNQTNIALEEPENLLLIERDSLYSFFENNRLTDENTSFIATYNSLYKNYTFNNIATLIDAMWSKRNITGNWNKAVLVPVQLATQVTSSYYSSTTTVVGIANEMNINSVKLVNSSNQNYAPRISVIYSKNE